MTESKIKERIIQLKQKNKNPQYLKFFDDVEKKILNYFEQENNQTWHELYDKKPENKAEKVLKQRYIENNDDEKIRLKDLMKKLSKVDLVLVEGFKQERHPKIEVVRQVKDQRLIAENDQTIIALATDTNININKTQLNLNDTIGVADFIGNYLEL